MCKVGLDIGTLPFVDHSRALLLDDLPPLPSQWEKPLSVWILMQQGIKRVKLASSLEQYVLSRSHPSVYASQVFHMCASSMTIRFICVC